MNQGDSQTQEVVPTDGEQLQLVELGMPADSQVVSYQYLTRAKHSLAHVTLDELEETLQLPEEQLLPLEEGEEYENFLQALQNNFDDLPEDDEEDIDFVLDDLLDSDWEEGSPTPQRRIHHPPRGAAKMGLHTAAEAGTPRQLPGQQCDVPNEVLGVPACMVPAEQYAADFDGQLYDSHLEEPALPAEAWFPEQSCSQPCGLDAAQIKQLYRQLNQHCQLMIQVYALTARNSQHQQTAASVKQLLEQYQGITSQVLDSGVDQMPHGKRCDAPYLPQLLGLASSVAPLGSDSSPEPAPTAPGTYTASTANRPLHRNVAPRARQQQQHRRSGSRSHGSQVTLTQHEPDTAGQALPAEQQQQQPRQPAERSRQRHSTVGSRPAAPGAGASEQAANGAARLSRSASPAGAVSRPSSPCSTHLPWALSCHFDVHSILEVSSMQLVPAFFEDIDKITADAQPEQLEIAAPTSKKDALKKANRLPPPLVPAEIKQAVAGFQELFDPVLFPKFQALPAQMTWTQGEDELLAAGLLRFGLEWSLIVKHLIPIKTETEIRDRQKNRCHRVEGNIIRTAKEHITRPLEEEEITAIKKGMEYLEYNWEVQRSLEDKHGLKDSTRDARMQPLNRWRLLPYMPQLNLQSRGGMVLYQMFDEATGKKPMTTRTGAAPGVLNRLSKNQPPEPAPMQPAFMEDGASPPKPQQKKHGGSRHVVLDPPVYLLFDDPANRPAEDDGPSLVAGRAAKIRKPPPPQTGRQSARAKAAAAAAAALVDLSGQTQDAPMELAEGIPVYPVRPNPRFPPAAQVPHPPADGQFRPPGSASLIGNPFRVQVPDIPTSRAQASMSPPAAGMPSQAAEASSWQQQHSNSCQLPEPNASSRQPHCADSRPLPHDHSGESLEAAISAAAMQSAAMADPRSQHPLPQHTTGQHATQHDGYDPDMGCEEWQDDVDAAPDGSAEADAGTKAPSGLSGQQQQAAQQRQGEVGCARTTAADQHPNEAFSQEHSAPPQSPPDYAAALARAAGFASATCSALQPGRPTQPAESASLSASASVPASASEPISAPHQAAPQALEIPSVPALPVLAEPRLQGKSKGIWGGHDPLDIQDAGLNDDAGKDFEQEQLSQPSDGHDTDTDTDVGLYATAAQTFDLDQLSQPASSQDDEDFEPDCLSQPDSTTEDEVELDEMSQPSSSDSDVDAAQQSALHKRNADFCHPAVHRSGNHRRVPQQTPRHGTSDAAGCQHQTTMSHPVPHRPVSHSRGGHRTPWRTTPAAVKHAASASQQGDHTMPQGMLGKPGSSGRHGQKRPHEEEDCPAALRKPSRFAGNGAAISGNIVRTGPAKKVAGPALVQGQQKTTIKAARQKWAAATAPGVQQQAGAAAALFSFRKKPRKPARPKCAVPATVPLPESAPMQQPHAMSHEQGHALRPRHSTLHSWGAKARRGQRSRPTNALQGRNAAFPRPTHAGSPKGHRVGCRTVSDAQEHQTADAAAASDVSPESDLQQDIDGVWTQWTDEYDRAIALACIIQHKGLPPPEVFMQLVDTMQQSGSLYTVRQVQARFECLLNRLFQNLVHQAR